MSFNLTGFLLMVVLSILLGLWVAISGCQPKGLLSGGVEKVCTQKRCYLRTTPELVHERCTQGKRLWDDGSLYDPADHRKRARACVVFQKRPLGLLLALRPRHHIWISYGNEDALAHEECHIELWEAAGGVFNQTSHEKCDSFGLGREKRSMP